VIFKTAGRTYSAELPKEHPKQNENRQHCKFERTQEKLVTSPETKDTNAMPRSSLQYQPKEQWVLGIHNSTCPL
jgi:hypothetical protein